ncbi:hypothetical protein [Deefgea sp. CFH1-16]|uniref:hypothetical protein n=1 Tax=Deefgea sp. CFH1-16 TaxID=2675457 RepID=UPI001FFDAA1E|nr:hypothetical protein [Deefgea sp. CFH1-16]
MPNLHLEIKGPIAYVALNRPEKRNAMSFSLLMDLIETRQTIKEKQANSLRYPSRARGIF